MESPKVAIIGAGVSGLLSAKYAKENGFTPTVFDKKSTVGGIWSGEGNAWPGLETNASKYTCSFTDHYWKDDDPPYIPLDRMHKWLLQYVDKFDLNSCLKLNTKVLNVARHMDNFKVTYELDSTVYEEVFSHVIVATGYFNWPDYIGLEKYRDGPVNIVHSAYYKEPSDYADKRVMVVGCSHSALQIAEQVCQYAKKVYSVFRRANVICPKVFYSKDYKKDVFCDLVALGNRELLNMLNPLPQNEINKAVTNFIMGFSRQNKHEALYVNPESEELIAVGCCDDYVEKVDNGSIEPIRAEIESITEQGVKLSNDEILQVDTIILGTGYKSDLSFLDEGLLKELHYSINKGTLNLSVLTVFNPEVKKIAFVGGQYYAFFAALELEAMLAFQFFLNKYKPKDLKIRHNANEKLNYNNYTLRLAEQVGCEPNVDEIKNKDPELYQYLMKGPIIPQHFKLDMENVEEYNKYSNLIKKWNRMFNDENVKLI
jgi:dimethylaniline monooxygenase (N-oxide forming)